MAGRAKLNQTWPWMTGAVILIALFMYWLYARTSKIETGTIAADTLSSLPRVADTTFSRAPERFSGRRILLNGIAVEDTLGRAAFTLTLPNLSGYPAIMERTLMEQQVRVVPGDDLNIAGSVYALNDSIISVWGQRGVFDPQNRDRLAGASTFFLVDSLDFVVPGQNTPSQNPGGRPDRGQTQQGRQGGSGAG